MAEQKVIYPPMHTAEHLLNQTMVRMFRCGRCFSAHIEKKKSKCDYRFDRPLADGERREIEDRVNAVIREDLPVTETWVSREEAEKTLSLGRLPGDAGELIRIVRVGAYDTCPCAGPHVSSTGELGTFSLISSDFENGVLRIRYRLKEGEK